MATPRPAPPPWITPVKAALLILKGTTRRIALPVALVVGTLLSAVNQAPALIHGHHGGATIIRIAVNYLVPYTVSSIGFLSAGRTRRTDDDNQA